MKAVVKVTLDATLKEAGITRNRIAVEGKIRPATISELCNGKSKAISFETLERILDALLLITGDVYEASDVIRIEYKEE